MFVLLFFYDFSFSKINPIQRITVPTISIVITFLRSELMSFPIRKKKNLIEKTFCKYSGLLIINLLKNFRKINELRLTIITKSPIV